VALRQEAEAIGRNFWNQATRDGQDLAAPQPSDVVAIGADALNSGDPRTAASDLPGAQPARIDDPSQFRPILSGDAGQFDAASPDYGFAVAQPGELDCRAGSSISPALAQAAGVGVGVFRGAAHTVTDALKTANFMERFANPMYGLSERGRSARDQVAGAVGGLATYADDRLSHPEHFGQDLRDAGHQANVALFPSATPEASTPGRERLRRFRIGENQGEVGFNGALVVAAPASEGIEILRQGNTAANVARFMEQGFSPEAAEYLASGYNGMGHHNLPRAAGWPADVADSSFFLLKPPWMNRGRFYERHFAVDPHFYGAKIRASAGGGSWSGNALGLKKYGPLGQFWLGTTTPLKTAAAAELVTNNALSHQVMNGDSPP
jgi:hypothetical protein